MGGGLKNTLSVREVIHMYNSNAEVCESAADGDYGFVFNNKQAEETFQWQQQTLFAGRVNTILGNINKNIRAV